MSSCLVKLLGKYLLTMMEPDTLYRAAYKHTISRKYWLFSIFLFSFVVLLFSLFLTRDKHKHYYPLPALFSL